MLPISLNIVFKTFSEFSSVHSDINIKTLPSFEFALIFSCSANISELSGLILVLILALGEFESNTPRAVAQILSFVLSQAGPLNPTIKDVAVALSEIISSLTVCWIGVNFSKCRFCCGCFLDVKYLEINCIALSGSTSPVITVTILAG